MRCGSRCGPGRIRIRPCAAHEASRWKGHPAAAGAARSGDAGERLGDERGGIRVEHRHLRPRLRWPSPGCPLKAFAAESEPSEVRGDPPLLVIGRPDAHAPGRGGDPRGTADPGDAVPIQIQFEAGPGQHASRVLPDGRGGDGDPPDRCEHDTGAQHGAQRVDDVRSLAERSGTERAQAVGEHPEAGLGLVHWQYTRRAPAQSRADQPGSALVVADAAQQEGGSGAQGLERVDGLKRVLLAGRIGRGLGAGEHKHSGGTSCVVNYRINWESIIEACAVLSW